MEVLDVILLIIAIAFIVLVGFVSFAAFQLARTVIILRKFLENTGNISKGMNILKNTVQSGFINFIVGLLKRRK